MSRSAFSGGYSQGCGFPKFPRRRSCDVHASISPAGLSRSYPVRGVAPRSRRTSMTMMPLAVLLLSSFAAPVFAQQSAAPFDAPVVTTHRFDRYAFLTDFDHDGFQDAVSWWWGGA